MRKYNNKPIELIKKKPELTIKKSTDNTSVKKNTKKEIILPTIDAPYEYTRVVRLYKKHPNISELVKFWNDKSMMLEALSSFQPEEQKSFHPRLRKDFLENFMKYCNPILPSGKNKKINPKTVDFILNNLKDKNNERELEMKNRKRKWNSKEDQEIIEEEEEEAEAEAEEEAVEKFIEGEEEAESVVE